MAVAGAGRQPFLAADGHSAPRMTRGRAPHAVVPDAMLPDVDGLQVLRALRQEHAGLPDCPIAHATKPLSLEEVMPRPRGLLRRSGAEEAAKTTPYGCSAIS
ncbi:hypothetical protein [Streptomyces sp. NBC_00280]|uniref:hypothetical protein n=1 Tax=Streptomyces sp. NBC_00280 TaxID=2975699 RepID=UPI0032509CA0